MSAITRIRQKLQLPSPAASPLARRRQATAALAEEVLPSVEDSGTLSRALATVDSAAEAVRLGSRYVHASALVKGWCPRRHAIFRLYPDTVTTSTSPRSADRIMWAIGRAVETHIRASLIRAYGATNFYGVWSCGCGNTHHRGYGLKAPAGCPNCRGSVSYYNEMVVVSERSFVQGSPDVLMRTNDGLRVLEIKSKKLTLFEALTGPDADHINQASLYVPLLRETLTEPISDKVTIIYGAKDYPRPGVLPYKDLTVVARLEWAEEQIYREVRQPLHAILSHEGNAASAPPLPPRLAVCNSSGTTTARNCTACTLCFQLP